MKLFGKKIVNIVMGQSKIVNIVIALVNQNKCVDPLGCYGFTVSLLQNQVGRTQVDTRK